MGLDYFKLFIKQYTFNVILEEGAYHSRDIKPTSSDISTQQDSFLCFAEVKECRSSFLLFLLPVYIKAIHMDVLKKLRVKFNRIAWRKENHHFLWQISFQERVEKYESLCTWYHTITLFQAFVSHLNNIYLQYNYSLIKKYNLNRYNSQFVYLGSPIIYINIYRSSLKW